MFLKFNNNNIWQVVEDEDDGSVVFYRRVLTPHGLRTVHIDQEIDENQMKVNNSYSYEDWKVFFGEEKLKKMAVDYQKEQYILPMLYYASFLMGLTDMVRERETKFIFRKRSSST